MIAYCRATIAPLTTVLINSRCGRSGRPLIVGRRFLYTTVSSFNRTLFTTVLINLTCERSAYCRATFLVYNGEFIQPVTLTVGSTYRQVLRPHPTTNCKTYPIIYHYRSMINTHSRRRTHIRPVGPGLATRSNLSFSGRSHPATGKRKLSVDEDLLAVCPQKVTHPAPFSLVTDKWFLRSASVLRSLSAFICLISLLAEL